jgi:ArsR family transcriptional regulator
LVQPILDHLTALADPLRCRMLLLLERNELTVGELCSVLQLPQSTVSRHLKTLADGGWVVSRRDGTSHFYSSPNGSGEVESAPGRIWGIVRDEISLTPAAGQDAQRLETTLASRRSKSQAFFASSAGQWDRLRTELFGRQFCSLSLLSLMDERWVVGDLGCGTGQVTAMLAPWVQSVIAVDASTEMLNAAREHLQIHDNVLIRQGVLEHLPIESSSLDAAVFLLVLHHLPDPVAALIEAARVLRPHGKLLVVDMDPHDREEYKHQMGHVWLGFSEDKMTKLFTAAGFGPASIRRLHPEADAKGPALFTAVARKKTMETTNI